MEYSLHRQLKEQYAQGRATQEVQLGRYRIDVVDGEQLIEIQHGSLAAIRDKIGQLCRRHSVKVVKPLVRRKMIVRRQRRGGREIGRRLSPKRGCLLDLFDELVYFTKVFPHRNLVLEVPLVDIEEYRYPGHGKRRRRRANDFQIEDQCLVEIQNTVRLSRPADLVRVTKLSAGKLPQAFGTKELAEALTVPRGIAQRIAYCWREMGAVQTIGKSGNALQYGFAR